MTNIRLSAHEDILTEYELATYAAAVQFVADFIVRHNGAMGKNSQDLFEEFRANVTEEIKDQALRGETDDVSSLNYGLQPGNS